MFAKNVQRPRYKPRRRPPPSPNSPDLDPAMFMLRVLGKSTSDNNNKNIVEDAYRREQVLLAALADEDDAKHRRQPRQSIFHHNHYIGETSSISGSPRLTPGMAPCFFPASSVRPSHGAWDEFIDTQRLRLDIGAGGSKSDSFSSSRSRSQHMRKKDSLSDRPPWDPSPHRTAPAALRGCKPVTPEPWAHDEVVYAAGNVSGRSYRSSRLRCTVDETSKPASPLSHNVVEMIDAGMTAYRRQLGTGRQVPLSGRHCRAWSASSRLSAGGRGAMARGRRRSAVIL